MVAPIRTPARRFDLLVTNSATEIRLDSVRVSLRKGIHNCGIPHRSVVLRIRHVEGFNEGTRHLRGYDTVLAAGPEYQKPRIVSPRLRHDVRHVRFYPAIDVVVACGSRTRHNRIRQQLGEPLARFPKGAGGTIKAVRAPD